MRRRPLLHLALAAAFSLACASCLSPTLPLPPPETETIQEVSEGLWVVAGTCKEGAIVTVFNETQGQGTVVEDRDQIGRYSIEVHANACDRGWVSQILVQDESTQNRLWFSPKAPTDSSNNAACGGAPP